MWLSGLILTVQCEHSFRGAPVVARLRRFLGSGSQKQIQAAQWFSEPSNIELGKYVSGEEIQKNPISEAPNKSSSAKNQRHGPAFNSKKLLNCFPFAFKPLKCK